MHEDAKGIRGERPNFDGDERDHFIQCAKCGSWIDCRDLAAVLRHEEPDCAPEPLN